MKIFIEGSDIGIASQIKHFCITYPFYASILGANTAKMDKLNLGSVMLQFLVTEQPIVQDFGTAFTAYKNMVRNNGDSAALVSAIPDAPVYPLVLPPLCYGNVESLLREIIQDAVNTKKLTVAIATALGIYVADVPVDLSFGTATLTGKLASGGHPLLHCAIAGYEGFEIWKDSGSGFVKLDVSNIPDYIDASPLPPFGTSVVWSYKAIYRLKNLQIGFWGAIVSVTVFGNI